MKKLALILLTANCLAQAPVIEWQKNYGGTGADISANFVKTTDGGYIFTGNTFSNNGEITSNHGASDTWVIKTDVDGVIQWQKTYGGSNNDLANTIRQTSDGGYVLAGLSNSTDGDVSVGRDNNDFWVLKIDANGVKQWDKSFGGTSNDFAYDIIQTTDGGYLVSGSSDSINFNSSDNHGEYDALVVRLNASGNLVWQKSYGGSSYDWGGTILPTPDGNYILCLGTASVNGNITSNHGAYDGWIVKIDSNGTIIWQKTYGGTSTDSLIRGLNTPDGGFIFMGTTGSVNGDITSNHGLDDVWIVKTDALGAISWQRTYGGSDVDNARNIVASADYGYVIGGYSKSSDFDTTINRGLTDAWFFKIDAAGNPIWQKAFGGSGNDSVDSIIRTDDNGYLFLGYSYSSNFDVTSNQGNSDFWIVKLSAENLAVAEFNPAQISLYPNPAKSEINLSFTTDDFIADKIIITDILGKTVLEQTGKSNTINTSTLASGMYLLEALSGRDKYQSKFIKE